MKTTKRLGTVAALCLSLALLLSAFPLQITADTYQEIPFEEAEIHASEEAVEPDTDAPAVDTTGGDTSAPADSSEDAGAEQDVDVEDTESSPAESDSESSNPASEPVEIKEDSSESTSAAHPGVDSSASRVAGAAAAAPRAASAPSGTAGDTLADALGSYDADHLQGLINDAEPGATLVLDGDFVLDKTVTINKPLVLRGPQDAPVTLSLGGGFTGRHLAVDSSAGKVDMYSLCLEGGGQGGGIYHTGTGGLELQTVTLNGNTNAANGGALYSDSAADIVLVTTTVTNNSATNGGGVYTPGDLYVAQTSVFSGNTALENGGGLWCGGLLVDNSSFTDNTAGGHGGGLYVTDVTAGFNTEVSTLYAAVITGNTAGGNGGGIAFESAGKHYLYFSTLSGNSAANGGGIWLQDTYSATLYIASETLLDANTATNRGGGLYGGTNIQVQGGAVLQNNQAAYGGGIAATWGANINESTLTGNYASKAGGGVYMMDADAIVAFQYSTISNNTTGGTTGGGVYLTYYTNIYTLYTDFDGNRSSRGVYWDVLNPAGEEQAVAAELYPNSILHTTSSEPFDNIYNDWDVSFFFSPDALYEVRLEPNGGTWQDDEGGEGTTEYLVRYFAEGSLVVLPAPLLKDGQPPVNWYRDEALTSLWHMDTDTVQSNLTLYAKWQLDTYTATFITDPEDDDPYAELPFEEGSLVVPPTPPTEEGMEFDGWYTDPVHQHKWDFDNDRITGDTTFYARWREDDFIDVLYMNEGSLYRRVTGIPKGQGFTAPQAPEKDGYIFTGWYTEDGEEWLFNEGSDDDLTLYAGWRDDALVDIVYIDGAKIYLTVEDYPEGLLLKEPAQPAEGHEHQLFLGWYTKDGSQWNFTAQRAEDDTTLYAQWRSLKQFTVRFWDGSIELENYRQPDVWELSPLTEPVPPTKDGWLFAGWYRDSALTNRWSFTNDVVEADTNLYARWVDDGIVDISYVVDGREYAREEDIPNGSLLTAPEDPQKDGHVFTGWYQDENAGGDPWDFDYDTADEDTTLHAGWRALEYYTVTYYVNGGMYAIHDTIPENTLVNAPREPYQRGSLFGGWYTDEALGTRWDFAHDTITKDMSLYARWRDDGLVDILFMDGDRIYAHYDDYEPDETIDPPSPAPEKEGYRFEGWYTEDGHEWDFEKDLPETDTTLYARWYELEQYTIEYYVGETLWHDTMVYEGEKLTPPTPPVSEERYLEFEGWYTEKEGEADVAWDFENGIVTEDLRLTAGFKNIGFDVVYLVDGTKHHREFSLLEGDLLVAPIAPTKQGHTFVGWYRGTIADLPIAELSKNPGTAELVGRAASILAVAALTAQPTAELVPVFWLFDTDPMPGEMLVLIAYFVEDAVVTPPDPSDGSGDGSGNGDGSGRGDGSGSGSGTGSAIGGAGTGGSSSSNSSRITSGTTRSTSRYSTGTSSAGRYSSGGASGSIARTGDRASASLFAGLAAAALATGALLVLRKRKKK